MRNSDRAWLALAGGVAAYDLIATDDERLSDGARRYFKSQPVATASMILVTGLHLIGVIPPRCDPFALSFAAYRRLLRRQHDEIRTVGAYLCPAVPLAVVNILGSWRERPTKSLPRQDTRLRAQLLWFLPAAFGRAKD
jgi:hypothetical protein